MPTSASTRGAGQVATRRRNLIAIILRWSLFAVIERLQRLLETTNGSESPTDIIVSPPMRHIDHVREFVARVRWYLPDASAPISIPCSNRLLGFASATEVSETAGSMPTRVRLVAKSEVQRSGQQQHLVWSWPHVLLQLGGRTPFTIVDPWFYSTVESVAWARLNHRLMPQHKRDWLRRLAQENFARCLHRWADAERAFVFATGPSLEHATNIHIGERDVRIVCNSIVRNARLLSHIRPSILVFADPVFHFGPSRYAATFREHALAAIAHHDCYCVVPEAQMGLLLAHYPQIEDRLIGMPLKSKSDWNFPSEEYFYVRDTGNILTTFMLPLASTLASSVAIVGADGRARGERYFWRHATQSQFGELMYSAVDAHPSFFRDRVYASYYRKHCRTLANQLAFGELHGVSYLAATPSHIPALAARSLATGATSRGPAPL